MAATRPTVAMAAIQIVLDLRAPAAAVPLEQRRKIKLALGYFAGLMLYFLMIWLLGFGIGTGLFTLAFLYSQVRMRWVPTVSYTAAIVGVALLMSWLLNLYWPGGVLFG